MSCRHGVAVVRQLGPVAVLRRERRGVVRELGHVVVGVGRAHAAHAGRRCRRHAALPPLSVGAQGRDAGLQLLLLVGLLDRAQDICHGKRRSVLRTEGHSISTLNSYKGVLCAGCVVVAVYYWCPQSSPGPLPLLQGERKREAGAKGTK